MTNNKPNKILVFVSNYLSFSAMVVALLWLVLGYVFILHNKIFGEQKQVTQQRIALEQKISKTKNKLAQADKLLEQYSKLDQDYLQTLSIVLPPSDDIPTVFTQLDALARANNSVLLSVQVNKIKDSTSAGIGEEQKLDLPVGIRAMDVSAQLLAERGDDSYGFYKSILASLEKNLRLFDLQNIIFSPDLSAISLNGTVYYKLSETDGQDIEKR